LQTKGSYIGASKIALSFKVRGGEDENFQTVKDHFKEKLNMNIEPAKTKDPKKGLV